MTDTIIKGTGNSRSIKSVTTLPLTWEDARAQLISSGWPVDIGAINAAGCQQVGDALNKANLLKDETAALFGLGITAVLDQVLAKIAGQISALDARIHVATGSYLGTYSLSGEQTPKQLSFTFNPKLFVVVCRNGSFSYSYSPTSSSYTVSGPIGIGTASSILGIYNENHDGRTNTNIGKQGSIQDNSVTLTNWVFFYKPSYTLYYDYIAIG